MIDLPGKKYEIRDLVYGFVIINDLEREVINSPYFQRLRRIKQLSLTNMVYPGAEHVRFEHSLGAMELASRVFDILVEKNQELLVGLGFEQDELAGEKVKVRLAGLLHDIGHAPFSHSADTLFPLKNEDERFGHEDYSAAIIKYYLKDIIENHSLNTFDITADEIAAIVRGTATTKSSFWRDVISGQLDIDRMDYLLRDSLHIGVNYGLIDLHRLVQTLNLDIVGEEREVPKILVEEGGLHCAEGLILSRYFMFTQVYFHKTRRAYDFLLKSLLEEILKDKVFPPPDSRENIYAYLEWDDWKVQDLIKSSAGENIVARNILSRTHPKEVDSTTDHPGPKEIDKFHEIRNCLEKAGISTIVDTAEQAPYRYEKSEIWVKMKSGVNDQLSKISAIIKNLPDAIYRKRLYVQATDKIKADEIIEKRGRYQK